MRKKLSFILCITLILCMIPTTSAFAAKKVKSKSVSVAPKSMTLMVGDVAQLNATMKPAKSTDKLTWTSSNKGVATVSKKGVVQGVSAGTATITVKTSSKKKAKCTVIVNDYVDENALREKIREDLKAEFATKNDIQTLISQNTYTKSEIDSKISAITLNDSSASCNCDIKTNNDVVNAIKQNTYAKSEIDSKMAAISTDRFASKDELQSLSQNTYTKSEIDSMIAAIPTGGAGSVDWEDGAEIPCLNQEDLPKTKSFTFNVNNNSYDISITIKSVTAKKYKFMDYDEEESFYAFNHIYEANYSIEGWDAFQEACLDYYGSKPSAWLNIGLTNVGYSTSIKLDPSKDISILSQNSNQDPSSFSVSNPQVEYGDL